MILPVLLSDPPDRSPKGPRTGPEQSSEAAVVGILWIPNALLVLQVPQDAQACTGQLVQLAIGLLYGYCTFELD